MLIYNYLFTYCTLNKNFFSGSHVQGPRPRILFPSGTSPEGGDRECLLINVCTLVGDYI